MANLSAPVVSRIAEQITRITSFESNDAAGQLLEVLEKQPLVTNATLWKIKRSSHTLCAKGRTTEIFNPDPLDARFLNEFVCRYDESFLAKVIESDEFHNYQPYVIEDVNDHKADVFFAGLIAHASRPLRKAIILPLKSHIQKELTEPGYFMVIYINEGQEGVDIHESLLRAIANKTSSTLSSQIEIGLNEITTFMKDTAIRHGGIRNILTASIKELIPKYFSYSHSLLIWRPSASARYECIYSTPDGITLTAAQTDAIAHMCVDRYEATAIVFDTTIFARILPQFGRYKSLIVAPIQNHTAGDKPHGFVILCDKLSPLARRINPEAAIVDRFDWEDELLMNHTISMISMVSELLYADDRRKQLADQLAHEMVMPANYIIGTCDEFIDYFENALDLPLHRQQKHITNIHAYAHLQMAVCNGILLGLQDVAIPRSRRYRPERVDLYQIVREIIRLTFPFCQQHKVKNDNIIVRRTLPILQVDRAAFVQIFLNTITNAIKYNGNQNYEEFSVRIDCEHIHLRDIPAEIMTKYFGDPYNQRPLRLMAPDLTEGYLITIEDWGMGIPEEFTERIFQRHFRVPGVEEFAARGSGLGLAIVRRIVGDHFGAVWLESRVAPTRFAIYLPSRLETTAYAKDPAWTREMQL